MCEMAPLKTRNCRKLTWCVEETKEFNEFVQMMKVVDIPLVGKKYTWYLPNGRACSPIDSVLVFEEWLFLWQGCTQFVMPRFFLDHCPIILMDNVIDWGAKPFRVLDSWLEGKKKLKSMQRRKEINCMFKGGVPMY